MKKIIIVVMALFCGIFLASFTQVCALSNDNVETFISLSNRDNVVLHNTIEANVNPKDIASSLGDEILFEYQPYSEIAFAKDGQKVTAKMYYYKGETFYMDSLETVSTEKTEIEKEIYQFYEDRLSFIDEKNINNVSETSPLFVDVLNGYKRLVFKPYGYLDNSFVVKKYRANDVSSLYSVETNTDFIPGYVANANGDTSYNGNMRNYFGFVHLEVAQAVNEYSQSTIYYGGIPHFKDAWPVNSPGTISISSTYNAGMNLGYSFTNGFSLDNVSIENQHDYGLNIGYAYSKNYTNQEPSISTQHGSDIYNEYQWSYQYADGRNGDETYHLSTGYLFEMNNSGHTLIGEDNFVLKYNFRFRVQKWYKILGIQVSDLQDPIDGQININHW